LSAWITVLDGTFFILGVYDTCLISKSDDYEIEFRRCSNLPFKGVVFKEFLIKEFGVVTDMFWIFSSISVVAILFFFKAECLPNYEALLLLLMIPIPIEVGYS